jgi:polyisoprenoid-binding protein YceI
MSGTSRSDDSSKLSGIDKKSKSTTMCKGSQTSVFITFVMLTAAVANVSGQSFSDNISVRSPSAKKTEVSRPESTYRLSTSKDVVMNLSGTTPVKNWTMTANGLSGEAKLDITNGALSAVEELVFVLPVHNLKGEVRAMDEDAYEALKADQHKEIVFKLSTAAIAPQQNNVSVVQAEGSLTVAGVTKQVTLKMFACVNRDRSVTFTGSKKLRMSDYDVERPSLLFGAIKASNDMMLTYKLIFTK